MERFEYKATTHPAKEFLNLVVFCSEKGECRIDEVSSSQTRALEQVLNRQGKEGWELVQIAFGKDGVMALWKRRLG